MSNPKKKKPWSLEIHHIDVGGGKPAVGDATLIVVRYGKKIKRSCLIDGGPIDDKKGSPTLRYLERQIPKKKGLDVLICTHYDDEHMSGLIGMLNASGKKKKGELVRKGHRLFRKTRVIDMGYNEKYAEQAVSSRYVEYLKSIYGLRNGALLTKRNGLRDVNDKKTDDEHPGHPYMLLKYVDRKTISVETKEGKVQPQTYTEPQVAAICALKGIGERKHVTRWVGGDPERSGRKEPQWLLKQKDLLWSNGTSADADLELGQPDGAPTLTCIAANCFYLNKYNKPTEIDKKRDFIEDKPDPYLDQFSLAFELKFNKFRYYIGGDLTGNIENKLCEYLNKNDDFAGRVTIIKTSQHGENVPVSGNHLPDPKHPEDPSTSKKFLQRTRPIAAMISCGRLNPKSQPHKGTVDRLENTEFTGAGTTRKQITQFTQAYYLTGFFNTKKVTGKDKPRDGEQFIPKLNKSDNPQEELNKYRGLKVAGEAYRCKSSQKWTVEKEWTEEEGDAARVRSDIYGTPGDVVVYVSEKESNRKTTTSEAPKSLFRVAYQGFKPEREIYGKKIKALYRPIEEIFQQADERRRGAKT